jgi:signal transduction histidine kinase
MLDTGCSKAARSLVRYSRAVPVSASSVPHYLAVVLGFNTLIAAALTAFGSHGFLVNFVFSQCIGLITYLCIDIPRRALWPAGSPSILGLGGIVLGAALAGWILGHRLGAFLLGEHALGALREPSTGIGFFVLTAAAGIAGTWLFWTRERAADLQRAATLAQLRQLQAQVEPHFLFNTLANLDALIAADPPRARLMLRHLNEYLRASLATARSEAHTLGGEFLMLRGYLEILSIRMGPRLSFVLDLPASLEGEPMPPMLLQPLVENAIRHGLEPKIEGGTVRVSARAEAGRLVLVVEDDGLGLDAAAQSSTAGTGAGTRTLRERLQALHGSRAALLLEAAPGGGTRATVHLPRTTAPAAQAPLSP